ncbi:MAG TPA: Uma2 family endonuclease [Humisphaera sp.]|jgi:Uma2 family endonuclease|nr:Uma2 family endonuclease [Humisphaera sp.]
MAQQLRTNPTASHERGDELISYEEFLETTDGVHAEWVDGRIIPMSAVSDAHQGLKGYVDHVLRTYVEEFDLGEVRDEPFQMKTGPDLPGRSPDVMFIAKKNLKRLKRMYLDGPADLVIEVTSPGTRLVDRGAKYYEYERGGVREYWLLDPERKLAEFYILDRNRIYRPATLEAGGIFRSSVLKGFWIEVGWLWNRSRPTAAKLLKAWSAK